MNYARVILRAPATIPSDRLETMGALFKQYVFPMPGTVEVSGHRLCDALVSDDFDINSLEGSGLDLHIMGMWSQSGEVILPMVTDEFAAYLLPDDAGQVTLHEPHKWAGWPDLIVPEVL